MLSNTLIAALSPYARYDHAVEPGNDRTRNAWTGRGCVRHDGALIL